MQIFRWWNAISSSCRSEGWDAGYYDDYKGAVEIYLLDKQNKKRYGIKLMEAFPKTIGATDLGQGINNELIKLLLKFY